MRHWNRRQILANGLELAGCGITFGCRAGTWPWQQASLRRIGYLAPDTPPTSTNRAFVQGLSDLGYVDGQNVEIIYRWAEGHEERLPEIANELIALDVAVIYSSLSVPSLVVREPATGIPVVFGAMADPVAAGLADSLA